MKFLYVDVKKGKLVGVFNNVAGNIKYLSADDIEVQKDKHQALNRINTVKEFDDALVAMQNHDKPKKFFKMYNPLKGMFKKK
ncbi:hypothetical protein N9I00_01785 [bacterium]|nr:hypothetical protein [bacterium]